MNGLLFRIVSAWATQEGQKPDYVNPGNIRDCPWLPQLRTDQGPQWHAPGVPRRVYPDGAEVDFIERFREVQGKAESIGWFWMPRTRGEGIAAQYHLLALHIAEGDTLTQFINHIAPAADKNQPDVYIANVAKWASVDPLKPMCDQIEPLVDARTFVPIT